MFHNTLRNLTLILKGWGLIDGEMIVIDGTKIRAQNSKHNCITQSGLDKKIEYAEAQINAYLMAKIPHSTGIDNPNSVMQMKAWLSENGIEADSLDKKAVKELIASTPAHIREVLEIRQQLAKSSVKKYQERNQ